MKTPFRKADPLADAQAAVERLEAQRRPLAERLSAADARVEAAQRARHEALVDGDPDGETTAKLDRACSDAIEARGGVEAALRDVAVRIGEAVETRDRLKGAAAREQIAADCERRAAALDAAAEALASAAEAFGEARAAVARAIGEHGVRVDGMHGLDGGTPVWQLAQTIVAAAIRLAAPGVLPMADAFGEPHGDDPLVAMRRAQSGKLRDHADDLRAARASPAEMLRPGSAAPAVQAPGPRGSASPALAGGALSEPTARTVFAVQVAFSGSGGVSLVQADPGDCEAPVRVVRRAEELDLAFPPDSDEGRAIVARLKASGGSFRAGPRVFIDAEADADPVPSRPARTITTTWPDERRT